MTVKAMAIRIVVKVEVRIEMEGFGRVEGRIMKMASGIRALLGDTQTLWQGPW